MKRNYAKVVFGVYVIAWFLSSLLYVKGVETLTLLQNIGASDNQIEIYISNNNPEIRFSNLGNANKIFIELLNTQYDDGFTFDIPMKRRLVQGLGFVDDISIGEARYGTDITKVGIRLDLKEGIQLEPRISFENNVVKVSFLNKSLKNPEPLISIDDQILSIYNKAVTEHYAGNLNDALLHYQEVIKLKSSFAPAKFNLARLHIDIKEYDKSLVLLRELADKYAVPNENNEENFLLVSNTIGVIYLLQEDLQKAFEVFNRIVELNPDYYEAYYNLGLLYERKNDLVNAKDQFKKSIGLKHDFVPAHYHLGILNLITKDKKEAIENFRKVLELDSKSNIAELSREELDKLEK